MTELTIERKAALYDVIRPEIRKLAHQMEIKFRLHDKERGNPFDCDDQDFMEMRLEEEECEFSKAIGRNPLYIDKKRGGVDPPSKIWSEGADCCNFRLMMIIDAIRDWKKRGGAP